MGFEDNDETISFDKDIINQETVEYVNNIFLYLCFLYVIHFFINILMFEIILYFLWDITNINYLLNRYLAILLKNEKVKNKQNWNIFIQLFQINC